MNNEANNCGFYERQEENNADQLLAPLQSLELRNSIQESPVNVFQELSPLLIDEINNEIYYAVSEDDGQKYIHVHEESNANITSVNDNLHSMESKKDEEFGIKKTTIKNSEEVHKSNKKQINASSIGDESVTGDKESTSKKDSTSMKYQDEDNEAPVVKEFTGSLIITDGSINGHRGYETIDSVAVGNPPSSIIIDNEHDEKISDNYRKKKNKKKKSKGKSDSNKKSKKEKNCSNESNSVNSVKKDEHNECPVSIVATESILINESQENVTIESVSECSPPPIISNTIDNKSNEKKCLNNKSTEKKENKKPKQEYDNDKKSNKDTKLTNQWDNGNSVDSYDKIVQPPSLTNIGATCYLNSAFQGISACDTFVKEVNDLCNKYPGNGVEHLHVFKELIDILNGCSTSKMEISRNQIFRNWNKPGQQDSYELLAYAMNQVYNQLRKYKEDKKEIPKRDLERWFEEKLPMRFIMQYQIKCGCGHTSYSPLQADLALHLIISNDRSRCELQKLVDLYFGNNPIEDYECVKKACKGYNTHRIARLVKPLPNTICIHLQRVFWDGYMMKKIHKDISFKPTLTLKSKYWSKFNNEVSTDDDHIYEPKAAQDVKRNITATEKDETYELASVIVHWGFAFFGHYICYKRVGNRWFLADDSSVHEVSESEVLRCQAYILFYEQPYEQPCELPCDDLYSME